MQDFSLWIVYNPQLYRWAETMKQLVEQHSTVSIEMILVDDSRCSLYGINRVPCFVALKYNQPFRKLFGKYENEKYINWLEGLNWLNK